MLEGILFDSDGVLVDSEEIYYQAVRESFLPYGVDISREEYVRRWMIEQTTTPGLIRDYNLSVSVDEIRDLKDKKIQDIIGELKMIPGAMALLERLHGKYLLGIVSSAHRADLIRKIGKFDLMRFFNISVSGDEVRKKKPNPEPYLKGCELLGFEPSEVAVIEDNPSGVLSAKRAGCKVIAYPNGFTKELDFSMADRVVKKLSQINEDMIRRMF